MKCKWNEMKKKTTIGCMFRINDGSYLKRWSVTQPHVPSIFELKTITLHLVLLFDSIISTPNDYRSKIHEQKWTNKIWKKNKRKVQCHLRGDACCCISRLHWSDNCWIAQEPTWTLLLIKPYFQLTYSKFQGILSLYRCLMENLVSTEISRWNVQLIEKCDSFNKTRK